MGGRTIGKLAQEAGVSVETIRFYERKGYLTRPEPVIGYRKYSDEMLALVRLLKVGQSMGFTLREVRDGLNAAALSGGFCAEIRRLALARHESLMKEREALEERIGAVETFIHDCAARDPSLPCPIATQLGLHKEA